MEYYVCIFSRTASRCRILTGVLVGSTYLSDFSPAWTTFEQTLLPIQLHVLVF